MSSVLIVDDQKELHDILKVVVQPLGCEVEFAFDGQEALDLFKITASMLFFLIYP